MAPVKFFRCKSCDKLISMIVNAVLTKQMDGCAQVLDTKIKCVTI